MSSKLNSDRQIRTLPIAERKESAAVARRLGGFTWSPAGEFKYVVTQDPRGCRRSIAKEIATRPTEQGSLF